MGRPAIIVHGGAGTVEDERRDGCVRGVERAADAGWQVLERGGSALDAVEAATRVMEDDPEFNAGYGGVLNRLGILETDACIMDGQLRAGAVGAVPWMRHPVSLARHLLEGGEHVLLVGGGALLYAREHGFDPDSPESMVSPRSKARHERALAAGREPHDTVGAVAVDAQGRVAAATSTGGTPWKRPGRVGDSPLPGCGNYADDRAGAASATGHGESIIRVVMSKAACDLMRTGAAPDEAARASVKELVERTRGSGGIVLVDTQGRIGHFTSTPRMPWAAVAGGTRSSGAEHS